MATVEGLHRGEEDFDYLNAQVLGDDSSSTLDEDALNFRRYKSIAKIITKVQIEAVQYENSMSLM